MYIADTYTLCVYCIYDIDLNVSILTFYKKRYLANYEA